MKKMTTVLLVLTLALSLAACGGKGKENLGSAVDYSNPSIVIEFGDTEGIDKLGSDMQNFEVEEGTVIKITGLVSRNFNTPGIMETDDGGDNKIGISMFLDDMGKEEYPNADVKAEAVGVARQGKYCMEFHVLKENLKIIE